MAGQFSLRKSKERSQGRQDTQSNSRGRSIRRLLSKAKQLFRRNDHVEPNEPSTPLRIPALPANISGLQEEIDDRLLFNEESTSGSIETSSPASARTAATKTTETLSSLGSCTRLTTLPNPPLFLASDSTHALAPSSPATPEHPCVSQETSAHASCFFAAKSDSVSSKGSGRDSDRNTRYHVIQPSGEQANATSFTKPIENEELSGLSSLFEEFGSPVGPAWRADTMVCSESASETSLNGKVLYFAQSASTIDAIRQSRRQSAETTEAALASQKTELQHGLEKELVEQRCRLERLFEESHDSSAKLHSIELLNLQDDHEAEVKELKEEANGVRTRLASCEKSAQTCRRQRDFFEKRCIGTEKQLKEQLQKHEQLLQTLPERQPAFARQTEELNALKEEMSKMRHDHGEWVCQSRREGDQLRCTNVKLEDQYTALVTEFNDVSSARQNKEEEVEALQTELAAAEDEVRQQEGLCNDLTSRLESLVAEKARDYTWHIAQDSHPLSMRPMNVGDEIAKASGELQEMVQEKEKLASQLSDELDAVRTANKNRSKKLKRVIANLGQGRVILEMALSIVQDQRDHWAGEFNTIAEAAASKFSFASYARGTAERHILLQRRRQDLESQLLAANLRGDQAVLDRAICKKHEAIKIKKRDAEIGSLKEKLGDITLKLDHEKGLTMLYKDGLDKEIPGLRTRNREVEQLLADQLENNIHADHEAATREVIGQNRELQMLNNFWQNQASQHWQELEVVKAEYGLLQSGVFDDLTSAHAWRDERDSLSIENNALRERFADDLRNSPLIIPFADLQRTSKAIEEQFSIDNIDDALLRHFQYTWSAIPKALVSPDAAPWEYIRSEFGEDVAEIRKKWMREREELIASFHNGVVQLPSGSERGDGPSETEAGSKGKWRQSSSSSAAAKTNDEGVADVDGDNRSSASSATEKGKGKAVGQGLGADGQEEMEKEDEEEQDPCADFF